MNSRSTFEEAMFLKILEESKALGRLAKRPREDSEEYVTSEETMTNLLIQASQIKNTKRLRTGSNSSSTVSKDSESPEPASGDAANKGSTTHRSSNPTSRRAPPSRTNRDKEIRDKQKEQQAAQRAEAASKRNARSERRRGEGMLLNVVAA